MEILEAPTLGIRHDLFRAIKYETRKGKKGTVQGVQCLRRFVLKWICELTWNQTSVGVITANRGDFHSTEALFNDAEKWASLDVGIHRDAGRCLAYFAHHKLLPLHCVNPHANNKLYRVTAP